MPSKQSADAKLSLIKEKRKSYDLNATQKMFKDYSVKPFLSRKVKIGIAIIATLCLGAVFPKWVILPILIGGCCLYYIGKEDGYNEGGEMGVQSGHEWGEIHETLKLYELYEDMPKKTTDRDRERRTTWAMINNANHDLCRDGAEDKICHFIKKDWDKYSEELTKLVKEK